MFLNDVIGMDVLFELSVTELVGGFEDDDGGMSEEESNLSRSIEDGLNNGCLRTRELWKRVVHFWIFYKITVMDNLDL